MFTVLMAVCDCDSTVEEEKVLHCIELLLEHGAKTGVYDRLEIHTRFSHQPNCIHSFILLDHCITYIDDCLSVDIGCLR